MTELSEQARKILDEGAEAALPGRSVADANWAALSARIVASPPSAAAPRTLEATLGAVGKLVVVGALVLGGVGVVALGGGQKEPHDEVVAPAPVAAERAAAGVEPPPVGSPEVAALTPRPGDDAPSSPAVETREGAAVPPRETAAAASGVAVEGSGRPRTPRASRPSPRRSRDSVDDLAEEERLVSAARRELPRDPAAALQRVEVYQRRFPDGVLAQEAAATRILALCQLGRREEGDRLAADFARAWPDAPALARVRGACREPDAP